MCIYMIMIRRVRIAIWSIRYTIIVYIYNTTLIVIVDSKIKLVNLHNRWVWISLLLTAIIKIIAACSIMCTICCRFTLFIIYIPVHQSLIHIPITYSWINYVPTHSGSRWKWSLLITITITTYWHLLLLLLLLTTYCSLLFSTIEHTLLSDYWYLSI